MDINIHIDFGQGYKVSLPVEEARKLLKALKAVFEPKENLDAARDRIHADLQAKMRTSTDNFWQGPEMTITSRGLSTFTPEYSTEAYGPSIGKDDGRGMYGA